MKPSQVRPLVAGTLLVGSSVASAATAPLAPSLLDDLPAARAYAQRYEPGLTLVEASLRPADAAACGVEWYWTYEFFAVSEQQSTKADVDVRHVDERSCKIERHITLEAWENGWLNTRQWGPLQTDGLVSLATAYATGTKALPASFTLNEVRLSGQPMRPDGHVMWEFFGKACGQDASVYVDAVTNTVVTDFTRAPTCG